LTGAPAAPPSASAASQVSLSSLSPAPGRAIFPLQVCELIGPGLRNHPLASHQAKKALATFQAVTPTDGPRFMALSITFVGGSGAGGVGDSERLIEFVEVLSGSPLRERMGLPHFAPLP
jgi:hypothetical protein